MFSLVNIKCGGIVNISVPFNNFCVIVGVVDSPVPYNGKELRVTCGFIIPPFDSNHLMNNSIGVSVEASVRVLRESGLNRIVR